MITMLLALALLAAPTIDRDGRPVRSVPLTPAEDCVVGVDVPQFVLICGSSEGWWFRELAGLTPTAAEMAARPKGARCAVFDMQLCDSGNVFLTHPVGEGEDAFAWEEPEPARPTTEPEGPSPFLLVCSSGDESWMKPLDHAVPSAEEREEEPPGATCHVYALVRDEPAADRPRVEDEPSPAKPETERQRIWREGHRRAR